MTPVEFAQNLVRSDKHEDRVLGVAIITRGVTDDDPTTHRQGWPLDERTVEAAARSLGIEPAPELIRDALAQAPKVSDAMLNIQRDPYDEYGTPEHEAILIEEERGR